MVERRDPKMVMRLGRLGSLHQSRLSFMRVLTRRMAAERWQFTRPLFALDTDGVGRALYSAIGPDRTYTLVAFAHDIPAEKRSDRVIADVWDATFTLFDGTPTTEDLDRLQQNVPLQEKGRLTQTELTLARANRSVRLWAHVVEALATGVQPDLSQIEEVGYLMRTTAVYGSGKFGAADREHIADRPELKPPFQAEMLTVYLIRTFVRDLVQHMACMVGGERAVELDNTVARQLGIGNSTGLGMAPFIINHPVLFNNWIQAREEAIARVRGLADVTADEFGMFLHLSVRVGFQVSRWHSHHPVQQEKLAALRHDLTLLANKLSSVNESQKHLWNHLVEWATDALSVEGQELLASLILEPYSQLVDGLVSDMDENVGADAGVDGSMTAGRLRLLLQRDFDWAFDIDWHARDQCARLWYVSEEKLEPRLGERHEESLDDYEQPLAPARDAVALFDAVRELPVQTPIAEFLVRHPEHRHTVRRLQHCEHAPYAEIRDNTISRELLPIDMLRAKLSFFGATDFDPRSDRWVRISMYGGAPYPEELQCHDADYWVYPEAT